MGLDYVENIVQRIVDVVAAEFGVDPPRVKVEVLVRYDVRVSPTGEKVYFVSPARLEAGTVYVSAPWLAVADPFSIVETIVHEVYHYAVGDTGAESLASYILFGTDVDEEEVRRVAARLYGRVRELVVEAKKAASRLVGVNGVGLAGLVEWAKKRGVAVLEQLGF